MDEYAVVEIKGHRRYGAKVSEIKRYGIKMMRAEVLTDPPFVQYVHPDSIFAETPCTEEKARDACQYIESPIAKQECRALPEPDFDDDDDDDDGDEDGDLNATGDETRDDDISL